MKDCNEDRATQTDDSREEREAFETEGEKEETQMNVVLKESLIDMYINKAMSIKSISNHFDLDCRTLKKIMKEHNIPLRKQFIDLTGKRFGRWEVLRRSDKKSNKYWQVYWECRCDCGTEKTIASQPLRYGKSTSCGCYNKERLHERSGGNHPSYRGGRISGSGGYVLILNREHPRSRNGYVFEHILIMEKHLGRPIFEGETVHHKNGIKNDNRIENLELWTGNHAPGVREIDMVEFCVEYLKQYAPHKLSKVNSCKFN